MGPAADPDPRPAVRVLIASQDPAERHRAVNALAGEEDIEVVEVDTPWEARRAGAGGEVDVLVLDGDLEPMGGFAVLYELRAEAELAGRSSPPTVLLLGRREDRWLARWAGADSTLGKPLDPFELARVVREVAGTSPAPRDAVDEAGGELSARPGA